MSMLATKDYGDTTFVTGMRAYAALGVLLIHAGGAGLIGWSPLGAVLVDFGRFGVHAFFVIAGFSAVASIDRLGVKGYLFARFFRIAPLYYFWMLCSLLLFLRQSAWAQAYGVLPLGWDLVLHLSFLHSWLPQSANSFLGVEWTVSVEMFWYLLLPPILKVIDRGHGLLLFFVALGFDLIVGVVLARLARTDGLWDLVKLWHPLRFFTGFALGAWAYRLRAQVTQEQQKLGPLISLGLLALFLGLSAKRHFFAAPPIMVAYLCSFFLLVFGHSQEMLCRVVFMNRPVLVMGTLSYGVYLCHYVVIQGLQAIGGDRWMSPPWRFANVLALSLLLSWALYRWIELPGQAWGKRFGPLVNKS